MSHLRFALSLSTILFASGISTAATQKEIDTAVQKGSTSLKEQYEGLTPAQIIESADGIGPAALAGLALLECGVKPDDAGVKAIIAAVREAAYSEVRTYQITLCIMFLDRLGDPVDEPVIQMLGVRLLAGQNSRGGWTYACIDKVSVAEEARLRTALMMAELKADGKKQLPPVEAGPANPAKPVVVAKLHPEVQKYAAKLATTTRREHVDDNSNTQFGVLGVWIARRHDVNVEPALDLIEKRFLGTQTAGGGWPYSGVGEGTASMTCAGLLALATAMARREERRMKAQKPDDEKANKAPKPAADARDKAIDKAFASLGAVLARNAPGKGQANGGLFSSTVLGDRDFYFLWSLERVGVIYEIEKIGNVDWYAFGVDALLDVQHPTGGWGKPPRGTMVETAFALLFLSRANVARDLTARVREGFLNTELRAGGAAGGANPAPAPKAAVAAKPAAPAIAAAPKAQPIVITPDGVVPPRAPAVANAPAAVAIVPAPAANDAEMKALAAELLIATGADWDQVLAKLRDGKGNAHTQALVFAASRLDGEKKKQVREALAERLTRMNAETLRFMVKATEAELRRAAILAMAMKDDKEFVVDLIVALSDESVLVVRAAHAGLKSLTGEDFGPSADATATERAAAIRAWGNWLKKQEK